MEAMSRQEMNPPPEHRQLFLRYALGEMTAEEREQVENALVSDADFFAAFQESEHDLFDAYFAGELSPAERAATGKLLESNKALAAKAELSEALRSRTPASVPATGAKRVFVLRIPVLAFAAAFLVAVTFLISMAWRKSHHDVIARLRFRQPATPLARQPGPAPTNPATSATLAILLPPTARSTGPALTIQLPADTGAMDVQWVLPEGSQSEPGLTLQVWKGAHSIMRVRAARFERVSGQSVAHFSVRAGDLASGNYLFQISSRTRSQMALTELETAVTVKRTPKT
jgi:anti-sigma factor RsiW